ncbi:MAG: HD domain-containing protein [Candidatus Latescibacteria bacterium]|nr:HD domain-containing protein [Candidatus Latescibacterota bacterium]
MSQLLRSSKELQRKEVAPRPLRAERRHSPPPATLATPLLLLDTEGQAEGEIANQSLNQVAPLYQRLVQMTERIFAAAVQGKQLEGTSLVKPLKEALRQLQQGEALLTETVRQRNSECTLPQRAVNTALLSMRMGLEIEYDERRVLSLGLCALMHDLGMLRVPAEVLGARHFTPAQRELLQRHPLESQRMVQAFGKNFAWIGKIVVQVHERSDGTGYPAGLKGEEIHEFARIIGLADTYEAMVHPRPDREVRAVYQVVKEIIDLRNTLFDRHLVKALIHIVSIFPLGSLVKLNNDEIGRVVGTSRLHPTRPTVEILLDARRRRLNPPRQIVLEEEPMVYIVDPAIEESILYK